MQTIHFNQPGFQTVSYTSPGIAPPSLQGWVAIEIIQPVQFQSNKADFEVICPTSSGGITATLTANPATYNGPCPTNLVFTGTITDNVGNRDVTYRFNRDDVANTIEKVVHFNQPGSQSVTFTQPIPVSYKGWMAFEISQPVQLQSNKLYFQVICAEGSGGITATLTANPATYNGPCPATIQFSGTIFDNVGNRDVTYRFNRNDDVAGPEQVIHFNQPGSQTVSTTWTLGDINGLPNGLPSYQGWETIEILEPVQARANLAEFKVTCTEPDTIAPSLSVPVDRKIPTTSATGELVLYDVSATDNVDGTARLGANNMLTQADNVGSSVTISCTPASNTNFPLGNHTVQCRAIDAAGNVGTASFIISVTSPTTNAPPGGFSSGTITAYLSANPATYNGSCPATIEFSGTITDYVGNRDVTYRFIFSDGSVQDNVLHFNQPGSQSVSTTRPLGDDPGESQAWGAIQILQPNYLQSNRAEIEITCTPSTGGASPQTLQAENTTTATDDEDTPAITDEGEAGDDGGDDDGTDSGTPAPPATTDEEGGEGGEGETEPPPATTDEEGGEGGEGETEPPPATTDEEGE